MLKKIAYFLLAALVVIQFFRPTRNEATGPQPNAIANKYAVPENVKDVLQRSCADCHSNNTVYPWYANVQPVAWWLNHHVEEGKGELNLDEFLTYSPKKAHHKLEEVIDMVKKGEMPLGSYTWIHRDAILSPAQKEALTTWADGLMKEIAAANNLKPEAK
jgi:hypothetical protein